MYVWTDACMYVCVTALGGSAESAMKQAALATAAKVSISNEFAAMQLAEKQARSGGADSSTSAAPATTAAPPPPLPTATTTAAATATPTATAAAAAAAAATADDIPKLEAELATWRMNTAPDGRQYFYHADGSGKPVWKPPQCLVKLRQLKPTSTALTPFPTLAAAPK